MLSSSSSNNLLPIGPGGVGFAYVDHKPTNLQGDLPGSRKIFSMDRLRVLHRATCTFPLLNTYRKVSLEPPLSSSLWTITDLPP